MHARRSHSSSDRLPRSDTPATPAIRATSAGMSAWAATVSIEATILVTAERGTTCPTTQVSGEATTSTACEIRLGSMLFQVAISRI